MRMTRKGLENTRRPGGGPRSTTTITFVSTVRQRDHVLSHLRSMHMTFTVNTQPLPEVDMTKRKTPLPATDDRDQPSTATAVEPDPLEDVLFAFESPESTSIVRANYDVTTKQLFVVLKKGGGDPTYRYSGVGPQLWVEFYQAVSKGAFFASRIRPFYVGVRQV